jgi:uncharacterized membrane protein (DUF4010 family)
LGSLPASPQWPPLETLYRLVLALVLGMFVGLEREWRGKEAGLRTFGFAALLGALGGMLGTAYGVLSVALLGVLIVFLNAQSLMADQGAELTTSVALLVTGMAGVSCGLGHTITPAAVAVVTAGLLAWKESLAGFSHSLSAEELRSAILLAILTFAIYPILPRAALDPWGVLVPRAVWTTVILVAAIGFVNYLLWKLLGQKGVALTGFFGGLVNSSVAVAEIARSVRDSDGRLLDEAYQGVLLATMAMALRNAVILAALAFRAMLDSLIPLVLIVVSCLALVRVGGLPEDRSAKGGLVLPLKSPFSLTSALEFGGVFLLLDAVATTAHLFFGHAGFYAVSVLGGLISSASAVASAAALFASGRVDPAVAGAGAVLASLASAGVNFVLVAQFSGSRPLTARLGRVLAFVLVLAIGGALLQWRLGAWPG